MSGLGVRFLSVSDEHLCVYFSSCILECPWNRVQVIWLLGQNNQTSTEIKMTFKLFIDRSNRWNLHFSWNKCLQWDFSIYRLVFTFPGGSCSLYPWVALTCVCFSYLPTVSKFVKTRLCGFLLSRIYQILTGLCIETHSAKLRPLVVIQARQ